MKYLSRLSAALLTLLITAHPVWAQLSNGEGTSSVVSTIDKTELVQLYNSFLATQTPSETLRENITEEIATIRAQIETEIWSAITPEQENPLEQFSETLQRQVNIQNFLENRWRERSIDLNLILEQEKKYLEDNRVREDVRTDDVLRAEYADVLAKKVILQQRLDILESIAETQEQKLAELQSQRFREQLGSFFTIGLYIVGILVLLFLYKFVQRFAISKITDTRQRYTVNKLVTTGIYSIGIFAILSILFANNPNILASLAIVGAGLAVALQDVVKDVVGWIIIMQGRFSLGERISIKGIRGDVVDISLLRTTLLEVGDVAVGAPGDHTGKTLSIPNSFVLTETLRNYNQVSDFMKTEFTIQITYESNWRKAFRILQEILEEETGEFSKQQRFQYHSRTSRLYVASEAKGMKVYMQIAASGVEFTLRFDTPVIGRRTIVSKISHRILDAFDKQPDIELAYDTRRVISTPPSSSPSNGRIFRK